MEKVREGLIEELIQGIEVANKLRDQFLISTDNTDIIGTTNNQSSSLNNGYISEIYENQRVLVNKMLSSFDRTITMAKLMMVKAQEASSLGLESPPSQNSHHLSKKRKKNPKEIKRVTVEGSALGSEGTLGDEFSWRKYGQKIIHGAKFPRGYYRCTHRHTQGCEATKQVQLLQENPTMYEINYSGEHTCSLRAQKAQTKPKPTQIIDPKPESAQTKPGPQQEVFLGLDPNGELKVEEFDYPNEAHFLSSLETGPFYDMLNYPAFDFESPDTIESDCFSLSVQFSDSEIYDPMSGPNSVTTSPKDGRIEFPLDPLLHIGDFSFEF